MQDLLVLDHKLKIRRWKVDVDEWETQVQQISKEEKFASIGVPEGPEKELSVEHSHNGDEVRLLLEGSAFFLVRVGETEEIVTVNVQAGDMISIPAGTWHRFGPKDEKSYKSVRFYHDKASWTKSNRVV